MEPDLSVQLSGIRMKNPIMPASGTFGYGEEASRFMDISKLGAVVLKTTTLKPRQGNPNPRICETDAGMINSIGLQNPGIEAVIRDKIPLLLNLKAPIIASIGGATIKEYVRLAEKLNRAEGVSGIEVNISCPNTQRGGIAFGQDPDIAYEVITKVKEVANSDITVIAKLTPNVTNIVTIAKAVESAGVDVISLINTVRARAKVRGKDETWLNGGLSGPTIKPIALKLVHEVAQANLGIPIIGIGGIRNLTDVLDFFECGADAVQIGTATFVEPDTMTNIINGLRKHMVKENINSIAELKKRM
jgi:dihydroorotate dehydrogenase (NAD+) catalytic subunit